MSEASAAAVPPDDQQEREERKSVNLGSFVLLDDGTSFRVTILDLSCHGCRIESGITLLPGLKLKISVGRLGALPGQVRWSANGQAGIFFTFEKAATKSESPREPRAAVSTTASLRRSGRQQYDARLFDLSRTGCKVEFIERPKVGEQVWIKLEGLGSMEAHVRWVDGFYGGLEFTPPIYPPVYEALLERLGA